MKNKKMKAVSKSVIQKPRAKYDCPEKIKDLIQILNLAKDVKSFPELTDTENFEKSFASFPENFQEYLLTKTMPAVDKHFPEGHKDRDSAIVANTRNEYQVFMTMRQDLQKLVDELKIFRETGEEIKSIRLPNFNPKIDRQIDADGIYQAEVADIDAILRGVYVDRLRSCEICNTFFWAENKNSFTCSEKCRNALRQRRFRSAHKHEIKAKLKARKNKLTEAK